jgi:hypothetical protein
MFGDRHRFLANWDGPVTAVASWHATAEEKRRAMPRLKTYRIIADLDRNTARGDLIALFKVATGRDSSDLHRMRAEVLQAGVRSALEDGRIFLLKGWDLGRDGARLTTGGEDGDTAAEKLARRAMRDRSEIAFEGRRYRIVAARSWSGGARHDGARHHDYRIVSVPEAHAVVARMLMHASANTPPERALWEEVDKQLSDDSRGAGLMLLRAQPSQGGSAGAADEPAVTPSQARATAPREELDWIEIQVVDEHDQPYAGRYEIVLPDGRKLEGVLGAAGSIRADAIIPGSCRVAFPDLISGGGA